MTTPPGTATTLCAGVLLDELARQGVRDVVVSPGSRSAPLAYAAFAEDQAGRITLHVRIDERSAGFLALGLAKASGQPTVVITTSGTAVANLHPAVLEAWHSAVPLLVISADRPATMINTGANQTTDQVGIFAQHVRAEARIAAESAAPDAWRFAVSRLVTVAGGTRSQLPGPVHLNVELVVPLTFQPVKLPPRPDRSIAPLVPKVEPLRLDPGSRTVIVAGDAPAEVGKAAVALARSAQIPLLAEPSSNARAGAEAIGAYRILLTSRLADEIERVIVFGHPTLSRPVLRLLGRADIELIAVSSTADWFDPAANVQRVASAVELTPGDPGWLSSWQQAEATIRPALERIALERAALEGIAADGGAELSGYAVASAVAESLGQRDVLVLGSSSPIRDFDLTTVGAAPGPLVLANRGLAGIDGTVSTAVGVALAVGRPTHALLGDLTFLHDANGLIIGPSEPTPALRIIVANDDGGSIFATLEHGAEGYASCFERLFGTPHGVDLGKLAGSLGLPYARAESADQLSRELARPIRGIEIIEAVVDRSRRRATDQTIAALSDLLG